MYLESYAGCIAALEKLIQQLGGKLILYFAIKKITK